MPINNLFRFPQKISDFLARRFLSRAFLFWITIGCVALYIMLSIGFNAHASTPQGVFRITLIAITAFGLFPMLIIKAAGGKISDYGWRLPEFTRHNIKEVFGWSLLLLILTSILLLFKDVRLYYGVSGIFKENFLFIGVICTALYYTAEEFLFRGFLFFSTLKIGKIKTAYLMDAFMFACLHIGKPVPEIIIAFICAMVLCRLSHLTKSMVPAAIMHFLISLIINSMATFFAVEGIISRQFNF